MAYRFFQQVARASQWFEARYTPLGQLLAGLVVAAVVFATDPSRTRANVLLAGLFASFTVAFICNLRWRPALICQRQLPNYAVAGEPMTYRIIVSNRGSRAESNLLLRDRLQEKFPSRQEMALRATHRAVAENWFDRRVGFLRWLQRTRFLRGGVLPPVNLPALAAGARAEVVSSFTPLRRGIVNFARIDCARADPLGISFATSRIALTQALLVLPRHYSIPLFAVSTAGSAAPDRTAAPGAVHGSHEFHALREYRTGDSLRHVHWRASAKRGTPVVKQFVDGQQAELTLLLDTASDDRLFESLVEVVASLVLAANHQRTRLLELLLLDARLAAPNIPPAPSAQSLLETLALLTPAATDEFASAITQLRLATDKSIIFITGEWSLSRQQFSRQLVNSVSYAHTLIVATQAIAPAELAAHCTVLRVAQLAEDLSNLTLESDLHG